MKIKWVEYDGFKSFSSNIKFNLFNNSLITGHNHSGKTSIAEGIIYTLYGRDLDGKFKIEDMANIHHPTKEVKTTVCILDSDTFEDHVITRIKNPKQSGYKLLMDDNEVTQGTIDNIFGNWDVFLSAFYSTYFIGLDNNDKRSLVEQITPTVDYVEIFRKKVPDVSLLEKYDVNINDAKAYKDLDKKRKETEKKINEITTEIEILRNQSSSIDSDDLIEIHEEEEVKLKQKLDSANRVCEKQIEINNKIKNNDNLKTQISQLETQLKALSPIQENDTIEDIDYLSQVKNEFIEKKNLEIRELLSHKVPSNLYPKLISIGNGETCPTCYQTVSDEHASNINDSISKQIEEISLKNQSIEEEINKIQNDIKTVEERYLNKCKEIQNKTTILNNLKSQRSHLEQQISLLQNNLFTLTDEDKKVLSFDKKPLIEEEYSKVVKHNNEARQNNILAKDKQIQKNGMLAKIDDLSKQLFTLNTKYHDMDLVYAAIHPSYLHKQAVELKLESITKHLKNTSINLFKLLKNGEYENTFDILYKHVPFRRLSYSEQILCCLEISNMINCVTGKKYPIFVDNSESIASIPKFENYQIIKSRFMDSKNLEVSEEV